MLGNSNIRSLNNMFPYTHKFTTTGLDLRMYVHYVYDYIYLLSITAVATPIFLFGFGESVKTSSSMENRELSEIISC